MGSTEKADGLTASTHFAIPFKIRTGQRKMWGARNGDESSEDNMNHT